MKCIQCQRKFSISNAISCKWCEKTYCMKCRDPNFHNCSQVEKYMKYIKNQNSEMILSNKVVANKVNAI